ncbi:FAS-associated death domain protein [Hetaerina americana]|uniref:FAS-associated death domain protein n=1 Tax=Hetaerina americana TaxID=62018 RepID=UPI003A7F28BA
MTVSMYYIRTLKDLVNVLERRAIDGRDREEFSAALVECVKLPKTERVETCASSQNDQEIPRHVLDMIADKIGRKWWDMARYLDVSEETIQEIEEKYRSSLKQQAYQALLTFCNQPSNGGKESRLLNALKEARRVDLKTKVERELSKKNGQKKNYRL